MRAFFISAVLTIIKVYGILTPSMAPRQFLTLGDVTKPLIEWAKDIGISPNSLRGRLKCGWSLQKALTTGRAIAEVAYVEYQGQLLTLPQLGKETGLEHTLLHDRYHEGLRGEELLKPVSLRVCPGCGNRRLIQASGKCNDCCPVAKAEQKLIQKEYQRKCSSKESSKEKRRKRDREKSGMLNAHGEIKTGPCEICDLVKRLDLDHCHSSGHIRGWLCGNCNRSLGVFMDSPEILQRAIAYLGLERTGYIYSVRQRTDYVTALIYCRKQKGIKRPCGENRHGECEICQVYQDKLHLDHDHATGLCRGWLCGNCNRGLGLLRDSPELIRRATAYLDRAST